MTAQRRASLFSLMGFGVWSAFNFLMNISMAKRGTETQISDYILATAIATPICDFAFLGLRGLQNSDGKGEFSFGEYLALRLLGIAFSLAALLLWATARGGGALGLATLLFGVRVCVDAAIDIYHGLTQRLGRLDLTSVSLALRGMVGFVAFFGGLLAGGLFGALWGQLGASVLLFLLLDRRNAARLAKEGAAPGRVLADGLRPTFRWHDLRRLLVLSLPIAVTMVIVSLNTQIGRYVAGIYLPDKQLNAFGLIVSLVALERISITALGVAFSTGLGDAVASDDGVGFRHQAHRLIGMAAGLTLVTTLLAALVGRPAVSLVFKPEYASDPFLITLVIFSGGITCIASAQGYVLTALRVLRAQVPIYGASLVTLLAANFLLIPRYGLRGAGWAMLLGAVVSTVASQIYIARGMRRWA